MFQFKWFNRMFGFILAACAFVLTGTLGFAEDRPPNFVIIFADDLGYGDLACFGHPSIATPNLDRMASEGLKLTQFYAAAPVCTPSRAALLTGRLAVRSGMYSNTLFVLRGNSTGGLPASEITIAEALKNKGYATACVGKWHLGHLPEFLPANHGFDEFFGMPYSNGTDRIPKKSHPDPKNFEEFLLYTADPDLYTFNVPLIRGEAVVERPADQTTLTRRYTEEAQAFIRKNRERPFFLYLAHTMPHVPLFRSPQFVNRSRAGLYGDVIEELDWSVGEVVRTLKETHLAENTFVIFTSDNGPWLEMADQGGSAGLLRKGKSTTWDGGMRVPTIAWWPGRIEPHRVSREVGSTMDLFATLHELADIELPSDRVLDSYDLSPVLFDTGKSARKNLFFYRGSHLMAVRKGPWKMHLLTQDVFWPPETFGRHDPPLLFNLDNDPSEKWDVAEAHPDVVDELRTEVARHQQNLVVGKPNQLELHLSES